MEKKQITTTKSPCGSITLTVNQAIISLCRNIAALNGLEKLEDSCVPGLGGCNIGRLGMP
ncbi:MAG: hypothetical protein V3S17_01205 [candidate division Zixibacteria bacterium]